MTDINVIYGPPPPDEECIQIEDSTTDSNIDDKPGE